MKAFHTTSVASVVGGCPCWGFIMKDSFVKESPLTRGADDGLDLDFVSQGMNRQFLAMV